MKLHAGLCRFTAALAATFVADNRPGAGGKLGADQVVKATGMKVD